MNRFILVALVVAGIFVLPYLFWKMEPPPSISLSDDTLKMLDENPGIYKGFAWWSAFKKLDSSESETKLRLLPKKLTKKEWDGMIAASDQKTLLIATFPTLQIQDEILRKEVEDFASVHATGWVVKQYNDLQNSEVAVDGAKGPGLIFIHDRKNKKIIIETDEPLIFKWNGEKEENTFSDWIDITTPSSDDRVTAWFEAPNDKGVMAQMTKEGIPVAFPAVVESAHRNQRFVYMTGDFSEVESLPDIYRIKGLATVNSYLYGKKSDAFYWKTFFPLLSSIVSETEKWTPTKVTRNEELAYHSRVQGNHFEIRRGNDWEKVTVKGVNIGMGKAGYFPGEAAITEEEYYSWFEQIEEMNANTIRVYTVQPPGFYRALKNFNETHKKKLYVFHGMWVEEELLEETLDAYNEETIKRFKKEYEDIIQIIHGDAKIEPVVGHASGIYDADISDYVIGWIMGIEWYPEMVIGTNEKHAGKGDFEGTYIQTKGATPFEYWLAEHLESITSFEIEHYNEIRPISFTNWVTTDLLEHPSEPLLEEDAVSVNPNVIQLKNDLQKVGQFASYHVYPYYPDFLNVDKTYGAYIDQDGEKNSYAGYLHALKQAHKMPILIAEFGIPASRGQTHVNPYGWNQGFMSEEAQGNTLKKLYRTILAEGYMGGLVFSWQDEWFKRTWNTMDYDNPERRPYWGNIQTNEQNFGLMSFATLKVKVDGLDEDWSAENTLEEEGDLTLSATHDETYLYIKVDGLKKTQTASILFDTIPEQGNTKASLLQNVTFSNGIDFIAHMKKGSARLLIDPYYDFYHYLYGVEEKMISPISNGTKNTGEFTNIHYVLNKEMYYPELKEKRSFEFYETGKLMRGNGDPESPTYNSLADYEMKDGVLELRIPWLLLQFRDPSRKEVIGDLVKNGVESSKVIDQIGIGLMVTDSTTNTLQAIPAISRGKVTQLPTYTWDNWDIPASTERLKKSYYIMQKTFGDVR
ncbi:hypothetical protein [Paenisporosarcina cavernae]|uniref:Uncharacterized protein n=1 Tax=Paenisporosarcina cavernae TaxID=2320858 RepID=A0A385YQS0_9BACL|nr:hypothetical protein [Paenisporosarcina cavernae]AYC28831.1 hypothetical protein D3873_02695 [Paenisporosarcina cavernae]